ncbi:MAG: SDR family oxidoreductase [Prevotellaceae bacterium]|jgi:NADP-dependent 3-hydroxy acid dehydrogenase YdfG|nr:SDR family oxidoreductase [Prevotellaceae bacterium]
MIKYRLNNKTVIITGASSGIGLACVYAFHRKGAKIVMAARNYDVIRKIEIELNSLRDNSALAVKTDVTVESDCKNLIENAVGTFGGVDILLNNAGLSMRANFLDVDLTVLKRLMDVNFWGAVFCTRYALRYLIENKGSLAGVSSVAGLHGLPGRTGYSASKYAMQGFMDAIRVENLKKGLHVMEIIPGFVATNIRNTALVADGSAQGESPREEEKMMTPEELAAKIVKGIEERKRRLTTSYEGKLTPLIKLLCPSLLDKLYFDHMKKEPNPPI